MSPASDAVPQVGAVAFRASTPPRVLLVRAKKNPDQWIFPKGHIDRGESEAEAVLRELREEAGVEGVVVGVAGPPDLFRSGEETVRVQYYLVRAIEERPSPEGRDKQWLTASDAIEALTFDSARELLRRAAPHIERLEGADEGFAEYLLAEYAHVADSLLQNEEQGEKRAAFFVTLTGAVGAALGFIMATGQGINPGAKTLLIITSLGVLLGLGYLTFRRLVSRNVASDHYKRRLSRIRRYFLRGADDPRLRFLPFNPYQVGARTLASWRRIGNAGWLETLAFLNAVVAGALVALPIPWGGWGLKIAVGAVVAALAWSVLIAHGVARYPRAMWSLRDGFVVERGALESILPRDAAAQIERRRRRAARRLSGLKLEPRMMGQVEGAEQPQTDRLIFVLSGTLTFHDLGRQEMVEVSAGDEVFVPAKLRYEAAGTAPDCAVFGDWPLGAEAEISSPGIA